MFLLMTRSLDYEYQPFTTNNGQQNIRVSGVAGAPNGDDIAAGVAIPNARRIGHVVTVDAATIGRGV